MMHTAPDGTLTFLFTDIEGSTRRWERDPAVMARVVSRHDAILRAAVDAHQGYVFKTGGDAFFVAFQTATAALDAALAAQLACRAEPWPAGFEIRVRMALHTGVAELRDGDYFGLPLNRVARLLTAAHGGQVLVSLATQQLVRDHLATGTSLADLGDLWLKDLVWPERVFQLVHPRLPAQFPPLRGLELPQAAAGGAPESSPAGNPYKGLRPFGEHDALDFFGRETLTARLAARLVEAGPQGRFLAVVGPSGSGKSSVVRAGLLPALRQAHGPGAGRWLVAQMVPGAQPLEELEAALLRAVPQPPASILAQLQADERGLLRAVKRLLPEDERTELVLLVDQFEEIFTLVPDEATRVHFLTLLCTAVTDPRSRVRVVVTLRADFYDRPLRYRIPAELLRQRTELVLPLSADEVYRAVTGPARRVGVTVAPELMTVLLQEVTEQPGALPLLQYALTELFERRSGPTLRLDAYTARGGLQGALSRRAEELYSALTVPEQELARQLFLRLLTLGEGSEDTRRRVLLTEIETLAPEPAMLAGLVEHFGRYRLLTFDRHPVTGEPTVEVAHEALIRAWERLRTWLAESRDALRLQRRLADAAAEWQAMGAEPSYLASGGRLAQFEALESLGRVSLNAAERAYLTESLAARDAQVAAEQRRQHRELEAAQQLVVIEQQRTQEQQRTASSLRRRARVLLVTLVVALIASGLALVQSQAARQSAQNWRKLTLSAGGQAALTSGNTDAALALALTANAGPDPLPQAQLTLSEAAYPPGTRWRLARHSNAVRSVAVSRAAKVAASGSLDRTVQLWDLASGMPLGEPLRGHTAEVQSVAFSPDGTLLASGASDQTVLIWDVARRQVRHALLGHQDTVTGVSVAADNRTVLSSSADGSMIAWDGLTGQRLESFVPPHGPPIHAVATSAAGTLAAAGRDDGTLVVWDWMRPGALTTLANGSAMVESVGLSPDSQTLVAGAADGSVHIWDLATMRRRSSGQEHTGPVHGVAVSPDGLRAASASEDNSIALWDLARGRRLAFLTGTASAVRTVTFGPDATTLLSGAVDGAVRVWDTTNGALLWASDAHTAEVRSVAYSPDGRLGASSTEDGAIQLWDVATHQTMSDLPLDRDEIHALAFSPDSQWLAAGTGDGSLVLWNVDGQSSPRALGKQPDDVYSIAWSPDGRFIATGDGVGTITMWEVASETSRSWHANQGMSRVRALAFSPDGTELVSGGGDRLVHRWEVATQRELAVLSGHGSTVRGVVVTPDGTQALSVAEDRAVVVWDLATGRELRRFAQEHGNGVLAIALSADGRLAVTGSSDRSAIVWEVATGEAIRRYRGPSGSVTSVAFAPNQRAVLAGSTDQSVYEWRVDTTSELIAWAQQHRYVPVLSCEQLQVYGGAAACEREAVAP